MDFDQLKGFYYTAKLKSFTGAAKKLYLTQPAISLKVKALENAVGEKLLERVGRRVTLTPAGEVLYHQAESLMAKLDEVERVVEDLKSLERGRLSIGASDTISIYFLPELLKSFSSCHPKIELAIESLFSTNVIRKVLDREVDLGIVTLCQVDKRLSFEPLFAQKFVCIVPEGHRFSGQSSVKISDLADEPLILLGKESQARKRIEAYFLRQEKTVQPVMELSSFEIIKRYVAAGLGASIVPERAVTHLLPGVTVIPLRQSLSVKVGVVFHRDRTLSHAATVFLNMAREFFRNSQGSAARRRTASSAPFRATIDLHVPG